MQRPGIFCSIAILAALALAPACKSDNKTGGGTSSSATAAADRKPVEGVNLSELDKDGQARFDTLLDKLPSPCGKAHSLRTSRNEDATCKRAPFAVEYLFALVASGAGDEEVKDYYSARFRAAEPIELSYDANAPHHGPTDATVKIAEYYDYACPACKQMKSVIDDALLGFETEVVMYYKQYPLSIPGHENSGIAAQAAIAADKQGKFQEMHSLLFANAHSHSMDELKQYATSIGLDMVKFQSDFDAAKALVDHDKSEGMALGIESTPTILINGIRYEGPSDARFMKMWFKEALTEAI